MALVSHFVWTCLFFSSWVVFFGLADTNWSGKLRKLINSNFSCNLTIFSMSKMFDTSRFGGYELLQCATDI